MIWLVSILLLFLGLVGWILLAPLVIQLDTRVPEAGIRWQGFGQARILYDGEWLLAIQLFFYRKTFRLEGLKSKPAGTAMEKTNRKPAKKKKITHLFARIIRVTKTFRVKQWKLALDTGDYTQNAKLFPLNFTTHTFEHLFINFNGENFLAMQIRNRPWKILYAFFR